MKGLTEDERFYANAKRNIDARKAELALPHVRPPFSIFLYYYLIYFFSHKL
jgi:hypothetical protein